MKQDQQLPPLPYFSNAAFDIVVIAASLGGMTAIQQLLSTLPADFPAAIIVVQHLSSSHSSQLADILAHHVALPVKWAEQGERIYAGTVYIAPPDYHVLASKSKTISLSRSERVQFVRPSANPLFESVAECYRERAIAVVLTGMGKDGASGVQAIKLHGGRVLVQDMRTSRAFHMPEAAIETGCVDFVLPLKKIATVLIALVMVRGAAAFFRAQNTPWSHRAGQYWVNWNVARPIRFAKTL